MDFGPGPLRNDQEIIRWFLSLSCSAASCTAFPQLCLLLTEQINESSFTFSSKKLSSKYQEPEKRGLIWLYATISLYFYILEHTLLNLYLSVLKIAGHSFDCSLGFSSN